MMNYDTACTLFEVKKTKRQVRKWNNKQGKAYKLAEALSDRIELRKSLNLAAEEGGTPLPFEPLFEKYEVLTVLGQ